MRVKPSASFPYPVLSAETDDYGDREYLLTLQAQEAPSCGRVALSGTLTLNDPEVLKLISSGYAEAGIMITCQDTYLDHFERTNLGSVSIDLAEGKVRGTVQVRGVVVATTDNISLTSTYISDEFPTDARTVHCGSFIAMTEEQRFEAGLDKLAPLESIFRLKRQEEIPKGTFRVHLEEEAIEIFVPPSLHQFISLLRNHSLRDTLLSSLYLPVVMTALEAMRDEDSYSDKRWHQVIASRCKADNIDIKKSSLIETAQQLLDGPLGQLQSTIESTVI